MGDRSLQDNISKEVWQVVSYYMCLHVGDRGDTSPSAVGGKNLEQSGYTDFRQSDQKLEIFSKIKSTENEHRVNKIQMLLPTTGTYTRTVCSYCTLVRFLNLIIRFKEVF